MKTYLFALTIASFIPAFSIAQENGEERQRPRRGEFQRPEGQRPDGQRGFAGRPEGPAAGGGFGGGPMMNLRYFPLMMALDTDEDGKLSTSEIENASKTLMKLDKDGDGILSAEELRPDPSKMPGAIAGGPGMAGPGAGPLGGALAGRMFEQRDANNDGKLTGDEIPDRIRERLSVIDRDGDGAISKAEMDRASAMMGDRGNTRGRNESDGSGVRPRRPGSDK